MGNVHQGDWIVGVVPALFGVAYTVLLATRYSRLPRRVATHFDFSGEPNGWMTRPVFLVFTLVILWGAIFGGAACNRSVAASIGSILLATALYGARIGLIFGAVWEVLRAAVSAQSIRLIALVPWTLLLAVLTAASSAMIAR